MKSKYFLGIFISIGIALISSLPKFFKSESINWFNISYSIIYTFTFSIFCWSIVLTFISKFRFTHSKSKLWYSAVLISGVILFTILYDYLFSKFTSHSFYITEIKNDRKIYIVILRGLIVGSLYYFIITYVNILEQKQKALIEIEYLKQAQLQANISSLKEQLSPHFLFNTLNTLTTLTTEQNVKEYVVELANVYRYVLQYQNKDLVTVKQEIEFVISYLFILKTRLENALQINIDIKDEVLKSQIPPLTIQILVENCIKHNIAAAYKPLQIKIYSVNNAELIIENNYQPKSSISNSTGTGLDNISKRYKMLFRNEINIIQTDSFFRVILPIAQ